MHHSPYSRRIFLQQGVTLASFASTLPWFIQQSAMAMLSPDPRLVSRPGEPDERILVVVQLSGGNDGLNTVVPYGSDDYHRARPQLAIGNPSARDGALKLDDKLGIGLHPRLEGFRDLLDAGTLAIIQGVGYPNPNRSHFASMDIWHTGKPGGRDHGWLGRYIDCTCNGSPAADAEVSIGRSAPLAMMGARANPVAFENARLYQWTGKELPGSISDSYDTINRGGAVDGVDAGSQAAFLMRTALDAQVSSDRVRAAIAKTPLVEYPGSKLAAQMQSIGAMIRSGMKTRVYYASIGGFDTHGGQANTHGNLMRELGESMRAFQADLKAQGNQDRVVTMVFSEFGRRVRQNGSGGTDHGTAAPLFLIGTQVKGGVHGTHPSLTDLDNGDLKYTTDFRSVYATLMDKWMSAPGRGCAAKVLGQRYDTLPVLRT